MKMKDTKSYLSKIVQDMPDSGIKDFFDVANTMERGDIDAALVPEPWGATLITAER